MKQLLTVLGMALGAVAIAAILIFLFAFPAMWLWNMTVPQIFNGPVLTFWQTFDLMLLVRFILPTPAKQIKTKSQD